MIASLTGTITYKSPELRKDSYLVIQAGGVGYKVFTPVSNLRQVIEGQSAVLYTYLAVSENAMDLYGFLNPADKTFFTLLLEVPGIGPKSAIGVLEKTTMQEVQQAILDNDPTVLTKMAGIGVKTADRIIVALKDKVESLTVKSSGGKKGTETVRADADAFEALVSFGYTAQEARKVLNTIDPGITDSSEILRTALKLLAKK